MSCATCGKQMVRPDLIPDLDPEVLAEIKEAAQMAREMNPDG